MSKQDFNAFIKNVLRRGFYKWPARSECLRNARIERGKYKCAECGGIFGPREIQVDHIVPVIDIENDTSKKINWSMYIKRLYCGVEGLQILDRDCHKAKTYLENQARRDYKSELAFGKKEKKK